MRADDEFSREPRGGRRKRLKAGRGKLSREDRRGMKEFFKSRVGVESYLEPAALDRQRSVALVASDGEWLRFALPDEVSFRRFAQKLGLPVYDAAVLGYPKRMKEYRRDQE
ncbi:MAG: oxidoreductase [Actinomycetota bacterium]|nr:oxidoreductase [Actinomycetota bacterium]